MAGTSRVTTPTVAAPVSPLEKYKPYASEQNAFPSDTEIVKIVIGKNLDAKIFYIHKELLVKASAFFKGALSGSFSEAQQNEVKLEEDDHKIFWYYYQWLYKQKIMVPDKLTELDKNTMTACNTSLISAYIMGDKFQDDEFCDAVCDTLISLTQTLVEKVPLYPWAQNHKRLYKELPGNSPLCRLMVDQIANVIKKDSWLSAKSGQLLLDVTNAMTHLRDTAPQSRSTAWKDSSTCVYHKHGAEKKCYRDAFK